MSDLLLGPARRREPASLVGRSVLLVLMLVWSWRLVSAPMGPEIMDFFMHLVNLPFHEAGHIIFAPFGRFMAVLGGSLAQLAAPLLCFGTLLFQTRDPFAASLCLWWTGESLLDLAPYIADARTLNLVLLGGHTGAEVEGHDWEYLLTSLGWLHLDRTLGQAAHRLGVFVILLSLGWAGAVLFRQARAIET